jgi:hypothetical protein
MQSLAGAARDCVAGVLGCTAATGDPPPPVRELCVVYLSIYLSIYLDNT